MRRVILLLPLLFPLGVLSQQAPAANRQFPPGSVNRVEDLPRGRFRNQLERLPLGARERALGWLRTFHFTELDLNSLQVDSEGGVFYVDVFEPPPATTPPAFEPPTAEAPVPVSPFPTNLIFHSRPGAPNVLYLNFTGESVSNTAWNTSLGRTVIPAVAFSTDSDYTTFSDAEQMAIKRVWQRMAEDYAPFDIDVTTERPASFGTRTAHALITRNTDANGTGNPSSSAGGVAYVGVFAQNNYATYRPAWIYFNNLASTESYIAEAASYEIGHNLGLSHDGTTTSEYYGGHGSGDISWGPLMGTGYNRNVSQWSKGEYYLANNTQDDLAIIAGKISYRPDDHGGTLATATALLVTDGTNVFATTPETDPANTNRTNKGILERNTDVDVFSFVSGDGPIDLTVNPWISPEGTRGGNLDVLVELYDQSGTLLATNNPVTQTTARIHTNLTDGLYYLRLRNTGTGNPTNSTPSGYTAYGSIGQYYITGNVVGSSFVIPPQANLQVTDITQAGLGAKQFTVTYSDDVSIQVSSISDGDVRVIGPNGYDEAARLVSVSLTTDGTPRVGTYEVDAPSGATWTAGDNGTYTISMQANEVSDTQGSWVVAGDLGAFNVTVPQTIYAANMDGNPGWTLEPLWEYGVPAYSGNGPTSGVTGNNIIAYNLSGDYQSRLSTKYATTPAINCSGAATLSLRFQRWLRLKNNDTALIQVSTNGTSWTDIWSASRPVTDNAWQQVQYALPSWVDGSPTMRLRWGIGSGPAQNDIGWNIDDVEILAGVNLDTAPPSAVLSSSDITSGGSPVYSFTVTYSDDTAVQIASLGSSNLFVTGPNNFSNAVNFSGVDTPTDGTPRTASYFINAPDGIWSAADNGSYQIVLQDGQVSDIYNNGMGGTVLGSFSVNIPANPNSLIVEPISLNVTEGSNATFTIHLAEAITSPVTVSVAYISGDADLSIQSGALLVFDSLTWSNPTPVTVAALPDLDVENGSALFECRASNLLSVVVVASENDTTPRVSLTVTPNNPSWGTVKPSGGTFPVGSIVEVLARPSSYYRFVEWTGDYASTNEPLIVTLNTNVTLQAVFAELLTTNYPTPLWWLAAHGYTNFESAVTQVGANGMPLWQSYIAGLDPNNPNAQLRLTISPLIARDEHVLQWTTALDRVYTVLESTNSLNGFVPLPGADQLPWTVSSVTNSTVRPATFYRLEVRKP